MKPIARGYVTQVARTTFWCRLIIGQDEFDAQIYKNKLSDKERKYLCEGAYISILKGGSIRFYKKAVTRREIERAKKEAQNLIKSIFGI